MKSLARHDVTQAELARCCGVPHQRVQQWTDRDRAEMPCLADVMAMPRPVALDLIRHALEPHEHTATPTPEWDGCHDHGKRLASTVKEVSDVLTVYSASNSDGQVTAGEAEDVEREALEAIRVLFGVIDHMREVRGEHGAPLLRKVEGGK